MASTIGVVAACLALSMLLGRHFIDVGTALIIIVIAVALGTFLMQTYMGSKQRSLPSDVEKCSPPPDILPTRSNLRDEETTIWFDAASERASVRKDFDKDKS